MILKRFILVSLLIITFLLAGILTGCDRKDQEIVVFSGKGLMKPMEDVKLGFENKYKDIQVNIIYGGSETLLETLKKTKKGDVFIPGSISHIQEAGDLVLSHQHVAQHKPVFSVRKDNPYKIKSLEDLLNPGVKIAIGNKEMCAIGKVSEDIFEASPRRNDFINNIAITATTVNELLDLVLQEEVDASLIWSEMSLWPEAKDLLMIEIPPDINKVEEIHIAVLATTKSRKNAVLFSDFVAKESQSIFIKHGFGE